MEATRPNNQGSASLAATPREFQGTNDGSATMGIQILVPQLAQNFCSAFARFSPHSEQNAGAAGALWLAAMVIEDQERGVERRCPNHTRSVKIAATQGPWNTLESIRSFKSKRRGSGKELTCGRGP